MQRQKVRRANKGAGHLSHHGIGTPTGNEQPSLTLFLLPVTSLWRQNRGELYCGPQRDDERACQTLCAIPLEVFLRSTFRTLDILNRKWFWSFGNIATQSLPPPFAKHLCHSGFRKGIAYRNETGCRNEAVTFFLYFFLLTKKKRYPSRAQKKGKENDIYDMQIYARTCSPLLSQNRV